MIVLTTQEASKHIRMNADKLRALAARKDAREKEAAERDAYLESVRVWDLSDVAKCLGLTLAETRKLSFMPGFPVAMRLDASPNSRRWWRQQFDGFSVEQLKALKRRCQLYRHFSSDGTLLYVGISLSTINRLIQHNKSSGWMADVTRIEITHYASTEQALAAERNAVKKEMPLFNTVHTGQKRRKK